MKTQIKWISALIVTLVFSCVSLNAEADSFEDAIKKIDSLVVTDLQKHNLKPNQPVTDDQFVRRIYLDVIGRVPTTGELNNFLTDSSPNRRENLINQLLESSGHRSHMYNWLGDMLRVKDEYYRIGKIYTFQTWIKNQLV